MFYLNLTLYDLFKRVTIMESLESLSAMWGVPEVEK